MRRFVLLAACALCGIAGAQAPIIRAHLEPAGNVTVGEPVKLVVTVLVPNYFTGSPEFPEFELENAIVVLPQETPQNSSEHVQGVTYAGITEVYTLYPQQSGKFSLPAAQVNVSYASVPPQTAVASLVLPLLTFKVEIPEAAKGLDYFLPTTKLTVEQRWTSMPKTLRVGDTIERTVTVTAAKMQAMLIPPLPLKTPDGIRVYEQEPEVHDEKSNRNEFLFGRRTQSAKYLIQKEGSYTLPEIELKWWNLSTRQVMTAVLPAIHFSVTANPAADVELPPERQLPADIAPPKTSFWAQYKHQLLTGAVWLLAVIAASFLAWQWLPRLYRTTQCWRKQRRELEQTYFRAVVQACKENHAQETYALMLQWLNRRFPGQSLNDVFTASHDAGLIVEIDRLSRLLFTASEENVPWNGRPFAELLKAWRHQVGHTQDNKRALVKLNP